MEIPLENTKIIQSALHVADSASQTISIENSWTISDIIEDSSQHQPHDLLEQKVEQETMKELLSYLDEREAKIIRMRYGLDNGEPMTLKEIGERVNLSRERVRQIENEALKRLHSILTQAPSEEEDVEEAVS